MKTLAIALAAATAATTLAAGAASAQPYGYARGNPWISINERQARLDARIERGLQDGSLNRREAWRLRSEFRNIARLEARYRYNGLSSWERADLDRRFDVLSAQIRAERRDGDRYGYNEYPRY